MRQLLRIMAAIFRIQCPPYQKLFAHIIEEGPDDPVPSRAIPCRKLQMSVYISIVWIDSGSDLQHRILHHTLVKGRQPNPSL